MYKTKFIHGKTMNITGERIRQARLLSAMPQNELSAKLELMPLYICRGSLSRIENGLRYVHDFELDAICNILGVSYDFLFGKSDSPE